MCAYTHRQKQSFKGFKYLWEIKTCLHFKHIDKNTACIYQYYYSLGKL